MTIVSGLKRLQNLDYIAITQTELFERCSVFCSIHLKFKGTRLD